MVERFEVPPTGQVVGGEMHIPLTCLTDPGRESIVRVVGLGLRELTRVDLVLL